MEHIIIIGNGIAGVTAARHIRKNCEAKITIISGESKYFFSRTALMYVYMGHMKFEHTQPYENDFWQKNKIDLVFDWVKSIDFNDKKVILEKENAIQYSKLILATGSKPNFFGWKGQDANGVMGLYHKQDLEKLIELTPKIDHAVILGGGLIGIELAEMLKSQNKKVTFIIRETSFWNTVLPKEESKMISHHIESHGIKLIYNTELKEILTDQNNNVSGAITSTGERIDCELMGITVGVSPNINFLKDSDLKINRGILVNKYLETNIPDVYAIGDCAELTLPKVGRRPIEAVWYCGRMMGETIGRTIAGNKTEYYPGIWFNSAKFIDIEYVTYGTVSTIPMDDEMQIFFSKPEKNISLRLTFNKDTGEILGSLALGIRLKHTFFDRVIKENWKIDKVVEYISDAIFDPEFFTNYVKEIQEKFFEILKKESYGNNKKLSIKCSI